MTPTLDVVTGASGFTGSHLVLQLLQDGREVLAVDLPSALENPKRHEIQRLIGLDRNHERLRWMAADLCDPATLSPLFARPVRAVFHTASLYDYSAPLERLRAINVGGTDNLLKVALKADIQRFVHWSTCGVFGRPKPASYGKELNNLPFSEKSSSPKTAPYGAPGPDGTTLANAYSVSKWEQEQNVWRAIRDEGLPATVVRPAPIYGPGSDYGHGGIILTIAKGYLPAIPKDANHYVTTSVHAEDIVGFARYAVGRPETLGEDYNVVDDSIVSYAEFLHYIALLTGRRLVELPLVHSGHLRGPGIAAARTWTRLERRFGIPRIRVFEEQAMEYVGSSYWLSNRKSLKAGYAYRYPDVRGGLRDTIAWMHEAGWL